MKTVYSGLLLLSCLFLCSGVSIAVEIPDDMMFVTEEYPPFNYLENGIPSGLSVELLVTILERVGINLPSEQIQVMAWTDAYNTALSHNNTCLFSTARNSERENLFSWAGPIIQSPEVFFAIDNTLKTKNRDYSTLRVVAIRDDIGVSIANSVGVPKEHIVQVVTTQEAVKRLVDGTSDAWVYAQYPGESLIQTFAENPSTFYILDKLADNTYYYAFSNQTEPQIIQIIQDELDKLKNDRGLEGFTTYEHIVAKYVGPVCANLTHERQLITDLVNLTSDGISRDATGTLADIQNSKHPYKDRNDPSLYVYIYDTSVTLIANAGNPGDAGLNMAGKKDAQGKQYRDEIVSGAMKEGSGFVTYTYSNPLESGIFYKEAYYTLVTGSDKKQYIVCAGRYIPCDEM
ncbi:MAG: transporter substrate-binding domain-containing protein [Methanomicrobiales archaeon]|nr:transporter substrate-binding domain-containing protein [Methanomicrobiales archaeon]